MENIFGEYSFNDSDYPMLEGIGSGSGSTSAVATDTSSSGWDTFWGGVGQGLATFGSQFISGLQKQPTQSTQAPILVTQTPDTSLGGSVGAGLLDGLVNWFKATPVGQNVIETQKQQTIDTGLLSVAKSPITWIVLILLAGLAVVALKKK